ncbi:type IV secretion protein Rhs [Wielerella bovis]|uniref:type IV secretion protein Rhs n=1 Tax=Wielerella bovis TaxID=2917790 RepID=UPI002019660C|nr:type IV secretion protein Rhs [Wielerella bovis]ULJ60316.1 type IV secretion protein Rhs [Wielerella bovis]
MIKRLQYRRRLTSSERKLLHPIYRDSIDYDRVWIHKGRFIPFFQQRHTAMTPFGTIHMPPDLYHADYAQTDASMRHLFVHEMAHVWQYQLGLRLWQDGLKLAIKGGYRAQACYAYTGSLKHCTHFSQFNMEQQANLIADWFVFRHTQKNPHIQNIMQDFIRNPNNTHLLPQHARFFK